MAVALFTCDDLSACVITPLLSNRRTIGVAALGFHPVTPGIDEVELKSA